MDFDYVRSICRRLPHTTEHVQWGNNLVFKVAGKMYAVTCLEPAEVWLSFKCTPDDFADLTERPGIVPAPYLARAPWVALESEESLSAADLKRQLEHSCELVFAKLPKRTRAELAAKKPAGKRR